MSGTRVRTLKYRVRALLKERACGKCERCGSNGKLEINHIQPVAFGGGDEIENLEVVCRECHKSRHTEAMEREGRNLYGCHRKASLTEKIWFCIQPRLMADLDAYCEEQGANRSEIIRRALAEYLTLPRPSGRTTTQER